MNPRVVGWVAGLLFLGFVGGIYSFLMAGVFLAAPTGQPCKADLMVSLGGEYGSRVLTASELYANGYSSRILLTGYEGGAIGPRPKFANWRPHFLQENGVPMGVLLFDSLSRNSWEEAVNTLQLMQKKGWDTVLVVSDPPHMRRLFWAWSKVFAGSDKHFVLVSTNLEGWDAAHWWREQANVDFVMSEYAKLVYYRIVH